MYSISRHLVFVFLYIKDNTGDQTIQLPLLSDAPLSLLNLLFSWLFFFLSELTNLSFQLTLCPTAAKWTEGLFCSPLFMVLCSSIRVLHPVKNKTKQPAQTQHLTFFSYQLCRSSSLVHCLEILNHQSFLDSQQETQ